MIFPSVTDRGVYAVYLLQLMFDFRQNFKFLLDNLPFLHQQQFGVSYLSFDHLIFS